MDPYIDPGALDPAHPLTPRKLDNLARADAAYRARAEIVDALPSKLTFQTTDVCNLSCPHCQIPEQHKTTAMAPQMLELLATQLLPDLIELHPTNLGEPFAWPHFRQLCALMFEHGVVLDLTTNGTLLDPARVEWIAPIARDIKVSFDGATAPTFERWRRDTVAPTPTTQSQALIAPANDRSHLHDSPIRDAAGAGRLGVRVQRRPKPRSRARQGCSPRALHAR